MRAPGARPPDHHLGPTGLGEAAAGFVAGLLLSVLAVSAVTAALGIKATPPLPVAVLAADVIGLWVGLVGAVALVSRTKGTRSLSRDFGLRMGAWWDLPLGAALGLACQYGLIPLLYLPFEHLDPGLRHQLGQPAQADTASVHTAGALAVILLLIGVGAPVVEELFFRGLVLRSVGRRLGAPAAVVVSAGLFALAHFEALQFAGLAAFGVVLGVVAWRTGRLAPGIAAHAAFNASAVISIVHLH
ncbi:MAG: lysostaphin resistance A-like protein [Acidimicrobiales bacterium]